MEISSKERSVPYGASDSAIDQGAGWRRAAIGAQGVMLGYFILTNHVPLYPWNNLMEPQLVSTLTGVIPFSIYILAFALNIRWLTFVGVVHSFIWLALQLWQWWLPYLFGPTALHREFSWYFENGYTETIRFLPSLGARPIPDAQHVVLELLSIVVVVTMTTAFLKTRRPKFTQEV
jgi:hypothetical protein